MEFFKKHWNAVLIVSPLAFLITSSLNYCKRFLIVFSVFRFQLLGSPWMDFSQWTPKIICKKICGCRCMCNFVHFARNKCHSFYHILRELINYPPPHKKKILNVLCWDPCKLRNQIKERQEINTRSWRISTFIWERVIK